MPEFDDRLRAELQRLAAHGDPSGVYDRVHERKVKRRIMRRLEAATLAVVVVGGTAGGGYALTRAFGIGERREAPRPAAATANGKIAFARVVDGQADIFVTNPDGSDVVRLTNDPADDGGPSWSPDGTRIAFDRISAFVANRAALYVMNGDGSRVSQVGQGVEPAWSPDGNGIAFLAGPESPSGLKTVRADGSDERTLVGGTVALDHPTWSSDGDRIAYAEQSLFSPLVCPSGTQCGNAIGVGIFVVRSDGSEPGLLGPSPIGARHPAWSPGGTSMAYIDPDPLAVPCPSPPLGATLPPECNPPPPQLNVMKLGGTSKRLTDLPAGANNPAWSPDGTQIVFDSGGDLYVINADGSNLRRLTSGPELDSDPAWQPVVVGPTSTPSKGPSPSQNLSPSGSPPPGQSPSPSPAPCSEPPVSVYQSHVSGDFDGDGTPEFAFVDRACLPVGGVARLGWALGVTWSGGGQGSVRLDDCTEETCRAYSAADLNGDGIDEFALLVDEGASTRFVEIYELTAGEGSGQRAAKVLPPGAVPFVAGEPARFAVSGSVAHQDLVTCDTVGEALEVFATSAVLSRDQTVYLVHETGLAFDPTADPPYGAFTVESVRDYEVPFDPSGQTVIPAPGKPCFAEYPG